MAIGKEKEVLQVYLKKTTKAKIIKIADIEDISASKVASIIIEKALTKNKNI